jgi:hypothetical protein
MGKDTFAKFLQTAVKMHDSKIKVKTVSFAGILKQHFFELYGWAGVKAPIHYENNREDRKIIIPALGINVVEAWVKYGETVRAAFPRAWADYATQTFAGSDLVIITDVRHLNEVGVVRECGGEYTKIDNPRVAHWNEGIDNNLEGLPPDRLVLNDAGLDELFAKAEALGRELFNWPTTA